MRNGPGQRISCRCHFVWWRIVPAIALAFALVGPGAHAVGQSDAAGPVSAGRQVVPQTRLGVYELDLPSGYDPQGEQRYPLILVLHGRGRNGASMAGFVGSLKLRDVIFARIDAPYAIQNGQGYEYWPEWTRSEGNERWLRQAAELTAQWCGEIVRDVMQRARVDTQHILVLGFSQGGALAYLAAMENPELFAGAAPLGGWVIDAYRDPSWFEGLKQHGVALFVGHGSEDRVIAPSRAQAAIEMATAAEVEVTAKMYPMGHTVISQTIEDLAAWIREICGRKQPE